MELVPAIFIFASALIARLVLYVIAFAKKARGQLTIPLFIISLAVIFGAGIFCNLLMFLMIQEALPAIVREPPFFTGIAVIIEPILGYGASRIAGYFVTEQEKASEEKPSRFTCDDGHVVKSRAEAMIDNWLDKQGITHEYEPSLTLSGNTVKPDWYLPDADVYVEFWGFLARDNQDYDKRRKHKEQLYAAGNKKLVGLVSIDLEDINTKVKKKLLGFLDEADFAKPKRCYNCGTALDDRYR
jgi:hypothetical protein